MFDRIVDRIVYYMPLYIMNNIKSCRGSILMDEDNPALKFALFIIRFRHMQYTPV